MNQEIINLEKLRQQIEAFRWWAGSTGDYIDNGNPTTQEENEAYNSMKDYTQPCFVLLARLHEQLVILRSIHLEIIN